MGLMTMPPMTWSQNRKAMTSGACHTCERDACPVQNTGDLFERASARGILCTLESPSPSRSYFWLTDWYARLGKKLTLYLADLQACICSEAHVLKIRALADQSHEHEPWRFATNPEGNRVWAIPSTYALP